MSNEFWRPAFGFPDYEVSKDGRLRRCTNCRGSYAGRMLTPKLSKIGKGYSRFALTVNGKTRWMWAHRMVWEAFNGKIPEGLVINHIDANPRNNNLENLEIVTQAENIHHAVRMGCFAKVNIGETNPRAKLTIEKVRDIQRMRSEGVPAKDVARSMGISICYVYQLAKGDRWKVRLMLE